jgi:hypothetical protein
MAHTKPVVFSYDLEILRSKWYKKCLSSYWPHWSKRRLDLTFMGCGM